MSVVVIAGALAAKPGNGGEAWVRLSWVLGLRRLGFDAWLLEEADRDAAVAGRRFFERTVATHGLGSRAILLVEGEDGPERQAAEDLAREAAALLNLSGNLRDPRLLSRFARRGYVDLDPGFTQIWHLQGHLGDQLRDHDRHFTVGLALGEPGHEIPLTDIDWVPVPPPVLLDEWEPGDRSGFSRFTSVATWRNALGSVTHEGRTYSLKHHQMRRFADVPSKAGLSFEIALDIHPDEADERLRLMEAGWKVIDPSSVAADPASFRAYVRGSGAEFSVAQGIYAETRTGWLGDRTAHYLACGRPAVVQDTGLPEDLRTGAGLLTFSNPSEAAAAARAVASSYEHHASAARALGRRVFDSDRVLTRVLEELDPA